MNETDRQTGAIVRPTDAYCKPESMPDESSLDYEVHPIKELEAEGKRPCPICYGDWVGDRS